MVHQVVQSSIDIETTYYCAINNGKNEIKSYPPFGQCGALLFRLWSFFRFHTIIIMWLVIKRVSSQSNGPLLTPNKQMFKFTL